MELRKIRRLAAQGEHLHLEFKRKANHPNRIVREMVAFANTEGGSLLIGVDDDGEIHGTKTPYEDEFALVEELKKRVKPQLRIKIARSPVTTRRAVLVFEVRESRRKPHFVLEEGHKQAYVRVDDMSVQASREMVALMRSSRSKGVKIEFGEQEKRLLRYLDEVSQTTLEETQKRLALSRRQASQMLITLVRAGLLGIRATPEQDIYFLRQEAFS